MKYPQLITFYVSNSTTNYRNGIIFAMQIGVEVRYG